MLADLLGEAFLEIFCYSTAQVFVTAFSMRKALARIAHVWRSTPFVETKAVDYIDALLVPNESP